MNDYERGYSDGLNANIKTLKPKDGEIIVLGVSAEYLSYDMAKECHKMLTNLFPENPVIVSVGSINVLGGEND